MALLSNIAKLFSKSGRIELQAERIVRNISREAETEIFAAKERAFSHSAPSFDSQFTSKTSWAERVKQGSEYGTESTAAKSVQSAPDYNALHREGIEKTRTTYHGEVEASKTALRDRKISPEQHLQQLSEARKKFYQQRKDVTSEFFRNKYHGGKPVAGDFRTRVDASHSGSQNVDLP